MSEAKKKLRKKLIAERLDMSKDDVAAKSHIVSQKVIVEVDWKQVKKVHVYTSLKVLNEIDTDEIQNYLADKQPQIQVTTSPARKDAPQPTDQYDLIIAPVLGFDKNNDRLGMGGGWYDRFLSSQSRAKTVGLAYSEALEDELPTEPHDVPLQNIFAEKENL